MKRGGIIFLYMYLVTIAMGEEDDDEMDVEDSHKEKVQEL